MSKSLSSTELLGARLEEVVRVSPSPPQASRRQPLAPESVLATLPTPNRRGTAQAAAQLADAARMDAQLRAEAALAAAVAEAAAATKAYPGGVGAGEARAPAASSGATGQASGEKSPEPVLLELTHVLNMVGPNKVGNHFSSNGNGGAAACAAPGAKPQTKQQSQVASELLVNSALRMMWPANRRKVPGPEAAIAVRDAAALLQEAAQVALSMAECIESSASTCPAREFKPPGPAACSETKRRRTFGGPSPVRSQSPGVVAAASGTGSLALPGGHSNASAVRGSPPVRFAGLRV